MKDLDIILIVAAAIISLALIIPNRKLKFLPYWLTYVVPAVLGVLVLLVIVFNAVMAEPPSADNVMDILTDQGYAPYDSTQEQTSVWFNNERMHQSISVADEISLSWYQNSFDSDAPHQISCIREELEAGDSRFVAEYEFGRRTDRCTVTNGSLYWLMIAYGDTLLCINGTAEQTEQINDLADILGYWE